MPSHFQEDPEIFYIRDENKTLHAYKYKTETEHNNTTGEDREVETDDVEEIDVVDPNDNNTVPDNSSDAIIIVCVIITLIVVLGGIGFYCYKKRKNEDRTFTSGMSGYSESL